MREIEMLIDGQSTVMNLPALGVMLSARRKVIQAQKKQLQYLIRNSIKNVLS